MKPRKVNIMKKIVALCLMFGLLATVAEAKGKPFYKDADKHDANYVKYIPKNKAVKIAYEQAGINADEVAICRAKIDREQSGPVYEIEFIVGNTEYEFDIDAVTGAVIGMEADQTEGPQGPYNGFIGVDQAKSIALNNAGIKPDAKIDSFKCELDRDDGLIVYEIDFFYNDKKYEYELDAVTGKVLEAN